MDARRWDDRYRGRQQLFSGAPNGVLVAEVSDLPPGRALDIGCGEGADAIWLARRGWQVIAVDISRIALERAVSAAEDVPGRVTWTRADLTATPLPPRRFDLVSAQYFPLPRQSDDDALLGILDAVAPGGTLLIAAHDAADPARRRHRGDAGDYYQPDDIARLLDGEWTVLVNETRSRATPAPAGTHHTQDTVLRAQRLPERTPGHD